MQSSAAQVAGAPAPLLTALMHVGIILLMISAASVFGTLFQIPWLRIPWRLWSDFEFNNYTLFVEAFVIFPLGMTLVLLSLRPALSDAKTLVRLTLGFIVYAGACTALSLAQAITFAPYFTRPRSPTRRIRWFALGWFIAYISMALVHLLVVLAFLPILLRGPLWKPPTRQLAIWRLRRFWRNWRLLMSLLAILALAAIIASYVSPYWPFVYALKDARPFVWIVFVETALFSLLPQYKWRLRLMLIAQHQRLRGSSWNNAGRRDAAADELAQSISQSVLTLVSPQHTLAEVSPQNAPVASPEARPASSGVDWPEQPAGLGAGLVIRRAADAATHADGTADADGTAHADAVVELGRGGFSVVLSAHLDGKPVAVKVARRTSWTDIVFRSEALLMQRADFRHQHLSAIVGTCVVAGCPALVLDYCSGGALSDALGLGDSTQLAPELASFAERWRLAPQLAAGLVRSRCPRRLSEARTALCSTQPTPLPLAPGCCILTAVVALAQAHLHSLGVLHCDLKASNVLLQPNARHALGHAVLSDFGCWVAAGTQRADHQCGSSRYMAPEVRTATHGALPSDRSFCHPAPNLLSDAH